jgi:hypothetical protein
VDKVVLWQVFLPLLRLFPVSIIPLLLHTCLYFNIAHVRGTSEQSLGAFRQRSVLVSVGELWVGKCLYIEVVKG